MITTNRLEDRIVGTINGKPFSCMFSAEKFTAMRELQGKANTAATMDELRQIVSQFEILAKESYKELVQSRTEHLAVNPVTNEFFLRIDDGSKVFVSDKALPVQFVERIMKALDKELEIEPLIKAWTYFLRPIPGRPAYTHQRGEDFANYISAPYVNADMMRTLMQKEGLTEDAARVIATTTQVGITQEGLLACYKVSEEMFDPKYALKDGKKVEIPRYEQKIDEETGLISYIEPEFDEDRIFRPVMMREGGDAFWCEGNGRRTLGHRIRVGCSHYLENWDQVSSPGSKGLHCGGLEYIRGYQKEGTMTHNIFVHPSDIHSISMYGDGAMTVKRYFVHSTFKGANKNIYHSSDYGKLVDTEYQAILKEVILAEHEEKGKKVDEAVALG